MQKQKHSASTPSPKRHPFGTVVFLLVIALLWFTSFKLVGGGTPAPGKKFFESLGRENKRSAGAAFTDASDYPVLVMFDNHPDSVPYQVGLSSALVVYEVLAEGGSTRFAGLFAGAPENAPKIGPVRSARPYVVAIASGWSAFFWHGGGSPEALELIPKTDVVDLNEISGLGIRYFWRDPDVPRPHNLFTSGDLIALGIADFELLGKLPREKLLWRWDDDPPRSKRDERIAATRIYVDFSEGIGFDAEYEYDAGKDAYARFAAGVAHRDNATGLQLAPANVIVQKVPEEGYYPSGEGRISLAMEGEGEMLLFQHGRVARGTWRKESRDSQTEWLGADGEPVTLASGQTWVEVVPGSRAVTYE